jgi:hypothetical protein
MDNSPALRITGYWSDLNDELIDMLCAVPEAVLAERFRDDWTLRDQALHIAGSRHRWMEKSVRDGLPTPDLRAVGASREALVGVLTAAWQRVWALVSDPEALERTYPSADDDGAWVRFAPAPTPGGDGHWIAFLRLRHDIEHCAQLSRSIAELRSRT